jgi:hypothetical protein
MTGPVGMQHLTLDTGDTRVSFRDEIRPDVIDVLQPLTATGTHALPQVPGCTVKVTLDGPAALVTVFRDDAPLVMFGVAADEAGAAELWPLLNAQVPEPSAVPWLAVRLQAGLALHPGDGRWLGDFERCWAWAWLSGRPASA